jgi:flagellin-like protein
MNDPRGKNPVVGVSIFIVVVVLLVIATLVYNALSEKRQYDRTHAPTEMPIAKAASAALGASITGTLPAVPASGASQ